VTTHEIPETHVTTHTYNTVHQVPETHVTTHDVVTTHEIPETHVTTHTYNTVHQVPETHVTTHTYNTVHQVPETHYRSHTYNTVHQVPETHVRTSTVQVPNTVQVPHTGYTTSYRTVQVPYSATATSAKTSGGYLRRRLADDATAAKATTKATTTATTGKMSNDDVEHALAGSLKYGEHVVGTYTQQIPYTVKVPHTYTVKVPHVSTYYKSKTNYKYVAKPYTVVTHLVCTPSVHVEYHCPACHSGNDYAGVADSYGSWLSPAQSGAATHVYHHVYHADTDTQAMGFGDVNWSHGSSGFYAPAHSDWKTLHYGDAGFAASASLNQVASSEQQTEKKSNNGLVVGTSVAAATAAVAAMALVAYKKRQATTSEALASQEVPLSIL